MSRPSNGFIRQLDKSKPRNKCRSWQLRVSTGLNPRTGKYGEKARTFHGSYRQAQDALREFISEVENQSTATQSRNLTFEQLADEWINHRVEMRQITAVTANKNRNCLNCLCRHIGKMPARKVQSYMISDAIKKLMAGDSPSGKPLSSTYALMMIQAGNTMYAKYAIPNSLATFNPFADVDRPKPDTEERQPLTKAQEANLMEQCPPNNNHHAGVALALLGGVRRGEAVRLDWIHVNLIDGVLLLPDTKGGNRLTATPMRPKLVEYLLAWKECQRARMAKYGVVQGDHTPVLANDLGDRMSGYVLGRWWRRNRAALGCPSVHYHDLRHTFATNLARHNVHPKAIQSLLRHKDDRTAMRIYTHVNVEQMMSAVMSLEDD